MEKFYSLQQRQGGQLRAYHHRLPHRVKLMEEHIVAANGHGCTPDSDDRVAAHERLSPFVSSVVLVQGIGINSGIFATHFWMVTTIIPRHFTTPATFSNVVNPLGNPRLELHRGCFCYCWNDGRAHSHITCNQCGKKDIMPTNVQSTAASTMMPGVINRFNRFVLSQSRSRIPNSWILVDNQHKADIFCNKQWLRNIRRVGERMCIHCDAGTDGRTYKATCPDMELCGIDHMGHAIANILSLHNVKRRWRVAYDGLNGDGFVVAKDDGTVEEHRECGDGLHYFDTHPCNGSSVRETQWHGRE